MLLSQEFVINKGSLGRNFKPDIEPLWASLMSLCNLLFSKSHIAICPMVDAEAIIGCPSENIIIAIIKPTYYFKI